MSGSGDGSGDGYGNGTAIGDGDGDAGGQGYGNGHGWGDDRGWGRGDCGSDGGAEPPEDRKSRKGLGPPLRRLDIPCDAFL